MERFWATRATVYYTGFGCNARWFQFRPTDQQLVYQDLSMGIRIDGTGNTDPVVPTPPCGDSLMERVGYDGKGTLYYQCSNTLLRGNGQKYTTDIASLSSVLADGRVIVVRPIATPSGGQFQVVAPDGSTASVLDAEGVLGGFFAAPVNATTTARNDGFVVVSHQADQNVPATELVVFHPDSASRWSLVRRFPSSDTLTVVLVISDGTVFVQEEVPATGDEHIIAYLPDSTTPVEERSRNSCRPRRAHARATTHHRNNEHRADVLGGLSVAAKAAANRCGWQFERRSSTRRRRRRRDRRDSLGRQTPRRRCGYFRSGPPTGRRSSRSRHNSRATQSTCASTTPTAGCWPTDRPTGLRPALPSRPMADDVAICLGRHGHRRAGRLTPRRRRCIYDSV